MLSFVAGFVQKTSDVKQALIIGEFTGSPHRYPAFPFS
jgi:hypothetical protein